MDSERVRDAGQVEYGELPELTRALRALGSSRRSGGSLQSQFFHPLLDARRRAAAAPNASATLRAFDATELATALDRTIDRIIAKWPDKRDSVMRALRAELQERVTPYVRALAVLSEKAALVASADDLTQLAAWRGWTGHLASTFDAADRSWIALRSVVEALPKGPKL